MTARYSEPWKLEDANKYIDNHRGCEIVHAGDDTSANNCILYYDEDGLYDHADGAHLERIVACVNACAGINPAAVPMMLKVCETIVGDDMLSRIDGDRDRLRTAARAALDAAEQEK